MEVYSPASQAPYFAAWRISSTSSAGCSRTISVAVLGIAQQFQPKIDGDEKAPHRGFESAMAFEEDAAARDAQHRAEYEGNRLEAQGIAGGPKVHLNFDGQDQV